jgi:apolipoprotein N-acyltransferase
MSFLRALSLAIVAGFLAGIGFGRDYGAWTTIVGLASFLALLITQLKSRVSLKRVFTFGMTFGTSFFVTSVHWLYISLHDVGGMPAPLAAISILLFCVYLSVYPALAALACAWASRARADVGAWLCLFLFPTAWVLSEWLRATVFTGFPWSTIGYATFGQTHASVLQLDPLVGLSQLFGVYARSWLIAFLAGALALALPMSAVLNKRRALVLAASAVGAILAVGFASVSFHQGVLTSGEKLSVALIQGNVLQSLKWKEGEREQAMAWYFDAIKREQAQLIVIPETALPEVYDKLDPLQLDSVAQHARARQGDVVMGVITRRRTETGAEFFNSAVTLGKSASQTYSKAHLVPFGEFIPPMFAWAYRWLNIPMGSLARVPTNQPPLDVAGAQVAVNICYEDVFGHELRHALPKAELLLNLTNVAWFGRSIAAEQHVQMAQHRSIELGRWTLRSTNTGVTAVIDEHGRIVSELPQFERDVLRAQVIKMQGTTLYTHFGDWPILIVAAVLFGFAAFRIRQSVLRGLS